MFTLAATQKNVWAEVWRVTQVATNLDLYDRLIQEAQKLGGHRTKKEAVNAALDEYVRRRKQSEIVSLFGTIDYDPEYD